MKEWLRRPLVRAGKLFLQGPTHAVVRCHLALPPKNLEEWNRTHRQRR